MLGPSLAGVGILICPAVLARGDIPPAEMEFVGGRVALPCVHVAAGMVAARQRGATVIGAGLIAKVEGDIDVPVGQGGHCRDRERVRCVPAGAPHLLDGCPIA